MASPTGVAFGAPRGCELSQCCVVQQSSVGGAGLSGPWTTRRTRWRSCSRPGDRWSLLPSSSQWASTKLNLSGNGIGTCIRGARRHAAWKVTAKVQAMDYTVIKAVCTELSTKWTPAKIERIVQADRFTLLIAIRTVEDSGWLRLCWNPDCAHVSVGDPPGGVPSIAEAFSFGEQLRYLLKGLAIIEVRIPEDWERVIELRLGARPLDPPSKHLFVEIMGRHSNVFLTNADMGVLACAYQVGAKTTSVRMVGGTYRLPPAAQGSLPSISMGMEEWKLITSATQEARLQKSLVQAFHGTGPGLAVEPISRSGLSPTMDVEEKESVALKMEEALHAEPTRSKKTKRPWNGPIWPRKSSPQPAHTAEDCEQRVNSMMFELEEDGVSGAWAVANVLDAWVGKVTRVDVAKVMRELGSRRNPALALEVFQWMQVQKGRLKPNAHTYSLILGLLGRGGMVTEARELFDSMLSSPVEVGVYSFNAMIGAYARGGNFKKAWRLYEDMINKGVQADEITISTLLNGAGKADLPVETVEKLFLRIKENGILPSVQTYNTLLSVLNRGGHVARCTELDKEMQTLGVVPDIYTFNTLLMTHVQGGRFDEAMEVFQRIRSAGLQPTVVTYTGLIQMYSRGSKHKEAVETFLEMQRVGCKPDLTTYSLMISVYGKAGSAVEAALVFRQLQREGLKPSLVTWSGVIQVFGWQGKTQEMGAYFNEMLASGCLPDVALYNIMMGAYGRSGHSVQAAILFRRMQAQGLNPTAVSYDTMIQAYCHSKQPADAHAVLDQMSKGGYSPDKISRAMLQQQLGVKYSGDSWILLSRKERRRMVPRPFYRSQDYHM